MEDLKARIKSLTRRFEDFKKAFNLAEKRKKLAELEAKSADPSLWENQSFARKLMQELGNLKQEIKEIEDLGEEIKSLVESPKEVLKLTERLEKLEFKTYLSGKYDRKNALVAIHAGQGGTEAMDWASMLLRMYLRFSERRAWKTEVLNMTSGEEAGIKSVTFKVKGNFAYGYLKGEVGSHRLVRQSPFNADKLRQTSFALVEVLPEFEEIDLPDIQPKDEDLEWQFFRASSQGGQNVQKVSTAVRLKHKPTGIVVTSQTERFQEQNRRIALNLLRAKLWALEQTKAEKTKKEIKGEYIPATWGTQIRSYVLHPYKMVKDLRTNIETSDTEAVLDGNLDQFIEAELKTGNKG